MTPATEPQEDTMDEQTMENEGGPTPTPSNLTSNPDPPPTTEPPRSSPQGDGDSTEDADNK